MHSLAGHDVPYLRACRVVKPALVGDVPALPPLQRAVDPQDQRSLRRDQGLHQAAQQRYVFGSPYVLSSTGGRRSGIRIVITVPIPSVLSRVTVPPCPSTTCRTPVRPSPVPENRLVTLPAR
jgi:hypothetical protein